VAYPVHGAVGADAGPYKKKTGAHATNFAVQSYDAAVVAIESIVRANSLDADRIQVQIACSPST
jgi:hypothetical protein